MKVEVLLETWDSNNVISHVNKSKFFDSLNLKFRNQIGSESEDSESLLLMCHLLKRPLFHT